MAKSHRDLMKRRLGYVLVSLDRVMEHALELATEFDKILGLDPQAEDFAERLVEMAKTNSHAKLRMLLHSGMSMSLYSQNMFEQFATHAWGGVPDKVERWTNTGQDYEKKKATTQQMDSENHKGETVG